MAKIYTRLQVAYKRHYRLVAAFMLGLIIALSYGLFVERLGNGSDIAISHEPAEEIVKEATTTPLLPSAAPVLLRIPDVGIEATFERPLGIGADGAVEVPDSNDEVGWYKYGPTPGELGPAVILGHVDSYLGPAVFYPLGQLEVGDEIFVDRADGVTATFVVTKLSRHPQNQFPTVDVYGDIDYAGLRLITCSGVYSHNTLRYSHNLIVFAKLKQAE
jgi:sortase (surface protein transpeptidase)